MKCKICGHITRTLPAMSKHYRKSHPELTKHRKTTTLHHKLEHLERKVEGTRGKIHFCPFCGASLNPCHRRTEG